MDARTTARRGHYTDRIEGSYRPITVHQLTLVWWLFQAGHITKRQLRVWFALHEMAERRRYMGKDREARYEARELLHLIGGRSGGPREAKTLSELSGDLSRLSELKLIAFSEHSIQFARSADQIALDDLSGFWTMLGHIDTPGRTVPVPRRMIRALAAGFTKAGTALIFTILIRCLFWHKQTSSYRMDGRYKLGWVAEVFGVSRRQLSDARTRLIDLGWISALDVDQWKLNRWGLHDLIDHAWNPSHAAEQNNQQARESGGEASGETACPSADFSGRTATPDLTDSLSLTGESLHQKPAPTRAGPAGVSLRSTSGGGRKTSRRGRSRAPAAAPNIRDIQAGDLGDTDRLLELHRQACTAGLANASEAGRLEFMALAERARCRGSKPGAMFFWLLRERKSEFITLSDEDEAARRLREYHNGRSTLLHEQTPATPPARTHDDFNDLDRFVSAVLKVSQKHRVDDPYRVARMKQEITRDQWDAMHTEFQMRQVQRWRSTDASSGGLEEF